MIPSRQGVLESPTTETRSLRSRPKVNTADEGHGAMERMSHDESALTAALKSEQPAKRVKLSQEISMNQMNAVATPISNPLQAPMEAKQSLRESSAPLSAKEPAEGKRRTWTLPKTKRASSLNLHNHPIISHPVGIAIWLLQKIDQARKSNSSDDDRSPSSSMPPSPGSIHPSTELGASGSRLDRPDSATAFSFKQLSFTGAQPLWGQSSVNEHEDDTARRRAQRDRKTKQRIENWAKNKENDVVARAKLEAKKKYGAHAQQEMERKRFVDERVKDDYGRLLGRQTAQFADALAHLDPFRVGHSDDFVASNLAHFNLHHPYVQAGKLLLDVLPALAESQVSDRSQRAADALLSALENGIPDEGSFFSFIDSMSDDETIQRGIDKVLGQLLNARAEDRRGSRSQASPAGGQLASAAFATSPDSASLSSKRLTWKAPATLKDNNFGPLNNLVTSTEERTTEPPNQPSTPSNAPQLITPPPGQADFTPSSSPSAYLPPSTTMAPPPPAQARSSGRERKPTAKVLAAGAETPSRQSTTPPSVPSRPTLTRNSRSATRVPSKLSLSEVAADRDETPPPTTTTAPTTGEDPQVSSEDANSTAPTADPRVLPSTFTGPLIPPVIPRSLQQVPPNILLKTYFKPALDPQLTANLLQLAEIAAYMSDSEDDELEMESHDLPGHERLIRELQKQESRPDWHVTTPISVGQRAKSTKLSPLPSASHLQTVPVNAASAQPTSLPPVNTTMSIKEAQAASEFFKSLVAGDPTPRAQNVQPTQSPQPINSETKTSSAGTEKGVMPAQNLQGSSTVTNGVTSLGGRNAAGNSASGPQYPGSGGQIVQPGRNLLNGKTQLIALNVDGQHDVLPQLPQPESPVAVARHATISPKRPLLPLDRKRKFEDEGNDIAMTRLRTHAASRGIAFDLAMSFEQLNAMIDNHDRLTSYAHRGTNGLNTSQISSRSYSNGQRNGSTNYISTGPTPTTDRPSSSEGLRRLAPSSPWPGYSLHYSSYNIPLPISPAAQYPPPTHNISHPDPLRPPNGRINNTAYGKTFQFVPPKQPEQFTAQNNSSPSIMNKPPPSSSVPNGADDARQQHQDALNGGPPGGGAVINSRATKRQQSANSPNYKFHVKNPKEKPMTQSQPKRGGQLMNFS